MLNTIRKMAVILLSASSIYAVMADPVSKTVQITSPQVRVTLPGQSVSSAYMTIKNPSAVADRLVSVSFSGAKEVQIHEMKMDGNTMKMRQLSGLDIPANGKVELRPGGNHLMLIDLKEPIQDGQAVKMTLQFEKAGKIEVAFPAKSMSSHMH